MSETRKELTELAAKSCLPNGEPSPVDIPAQGQLLAQLGDAWTIIEAHHLARSFAFPDFMQGLAFVNAVADIAETEGHHPDLRLSWGEVLVTVWTHDVDGLSEGDFVLAAKISQAYARANA